MTKAIKDDPTVGTDPIIGETPTVEINGVEYKLRRLGVRDMFAVGRIMAAGLSKASGRELNATTAIEALTAGLFFNETEAIKILAGVIGVAPADFADPDKFSADAVIDVVAALSEHQDLKAFLDKAGKLLKAVPDAATPTASPAQST